MARTHITWNTDFSKIESRLLAAWGAYMTPTPSRSKPMFTKQHYEAVAKLLSEMREFVREGEAPSDVRVEQMQIVNEVTMRFSLMFKKDSKKFKDLLFIGACDAGASTEPRAK